MRYSNVSSSAWPILGSLRRFRGRFWTVLAWLAIYSSIVAAQDNVVAPSSSVTSQADDRSADDSEVKSTPENQPVSMTHSEKRKKLTAVLSAIGGIVVLGVAAIAMVMLWARRLRRLARDLGPAQKTAGNDFWFLKPPKPFVSESDIPETRRSLDPPSSSKPPE